MEVGCDNLNRSIERAVVQGLRILLNNVDSISCLDRHKSLARTIYEA